MFDFVFCQHCILEDDFNYCSIIIHHPKTGFSSPGVVFCYDRCIRARSCTGFSYQVDKRAASKSEKYQCFLYWDAFTVKDVSVCNDELYGYTWIKPVDFNIRDAHCLRNKK